MALSEGQKERLRMLRQGITAVAVSADDKAASQAVDLYPVLRYDGELVPAGTRINWEGALMRAAVALWDREDQDPAHAPMLWEAIAYREGVRIIPETITATLAFSKDELGYWPNDGKVYRSLSDGNTHAPGVSPVPTWEEVE